MLHRWNSPNTHFSIARRKWVSELGRRSLIVGELAGDKYLLGLPSLLCHDDLWTNNILFKKADDGTGQNEVAAFIDWQTVFTGKHRLEDRIA